MALTEAGTGRLRPGEVTLEAAPVLVSEALRHHRLGRVTDQVAARVAEQTLGLGVDEHDPVVPADDDDRVGHGLDETSEGRLRGTGLAQVLDVVRKVAEGRSVSLAQVAIAWLMARPAVSSLPRPIGIASPRHYLRNLG